MSEAEKNMTDDGPKIVIEGPREDWPGGVRTLTQCKPYRDSDRLQVYWFGAELDQEDGNEVWFRIILEAIHRMQENTPRASGDPDAGPSAGAQA